MPAGSRRPRGVDQNLDVVPERRTSGERVVGGTAGDDISVRCIAVERRRTRRRHGEAGGGPLKSRSGRIGRDRGKRSAYSRYHKGSAEEQPEPCPMSTPSPDTAATQSAGAGSPEVVAGRIPAALIVHRGRRDHGVQTVRGVRSHYEDAVWRFVEGQVSGCCTWRGVTAGPWRATHVPFGQAEGSRTVTVVPRSRPESMVTVPWWAATIPATIASPSPVPDRVLLASARQKRSNALPASSGVIPGPESTTSTVTRFPTAMARIEIDALKLNRPAVIQVGEQ